MTNASVCLGILLAFAVALGAQISDSPCVGNTDYGDPAERTKGDLSMPNHFTGSARVQSLFDAKHSSHRMGGNVTFQAGARSVWHTHPIGQALIVTKGEGWAQAWGDPVQVMRTGDVIWIPASVSTGIVNRLAPRSPISSCRKNKRD